MIPITPTAADDHDEADADAAAVEAAAVAIAELGADDDDDEKMEKHPNATGTVSGTGTTAFMSITSSQLSPSSSIHFTPYNDNRSVIKSLQRRKYKKAYTNCTEKWPRCCAVLTKMIALWSLICFALLFGYFLSTFEGPGELESNDAFMRESYLLARLPINETIKVLVNMPTECFDRFIADKTNEMGGNSSASASASSAIEQTTLGGGLSQLSANDFWNNVTNEALLLNHGRTNIQNNEINNEINASNDTTVDILMELYEYMEQCEEISSLYLTSLVNYVAESAAFVNSSSDVLTFNWIRCWNSTLLGNQNPFAPNKAQINASAQQGKWYADVWLDDQQRLTEQYINELQCEEQRLDDDETQNKTESERLRCILRATELATQQASGQGGCSTNVASSAWFWFTVMTTVGYGNFAPTTMAGRALVSGLGWLSIIAFGAITILSGGTWTAVTDDFFRRINMPFLSRPSYGTVLWGLASCGWIALVAMWALEWWRERVPDFAQGVSVADSYWFAYITTLTVGLGDYYLQPQGLYLSDVFSWASRLLTGFVVVSTFLGKFGELVANIFPEPSESLADHLERTDCRGNDVGLDVDQSKSVQALQDLVDKQTVGNDQMSSTVGDEDDKQRLGVDGRPINSQRIETLLRKRQLILQLLDASETELKSRLAQYRVYRTGKVHGNVDTSVEWNESDLTYQQSILEMALQHTIEAKDEYEKTRTGEMKYP